MPGWVTQTKRVWRGLGHSRSRRRCPISYIRTHVRAEPVASSLEGRTAPKPPPTQFLALVAARGLSGHGPTVCGHGDEAVKSAELLIPAVATILVAVIALLAQWHAPEKDRLVALQEIEAVERLRNLGLYDSAEQVAQVLAARTRSWRYSTEWWYFGAFRPGFRLVQVAGMLWIGGLVLGGVAVLFLGDNPATLQDTAPGRASLLVLRAAGTILAVSVLLYGLLALIAWLITRRRGRAPQPLLLPPPPPLPAPASPTPPADSASPPLPPARRRWWRQRA